MKTLLQRVTEASVSLEGEVLSAPASKYDGQTYQANRGHQENP